jgi:hypothetical protein
VRDILLDGIGGTSRAIAAMRFAFGSFFVLSGVHKLTNKERHKTFVETDSSPLCAPKQTSVRRSKLTGSSLAWWVGVAVPAAGEGVRKGSTPADTRVRRQKTVGSCCGSVKTVLQW